MNQQSLQDGEQSQQSINAPPLIYKIKQYRANTMLSQFSYMLIRPPRFMYNEQLLYPPENYQVRYKLEHHEIPFKLTLYKPDNMLYVILYLHGNSSSRFEGYMNLKDLPDGVGLACFDFNGCGMRFQNQFITLGCKECKDVDIAARYLKKLGHRVVGWGRSMGSVSLLLSQELDVMVADSPFYSLVELCEQISYKATPSVCCCFFHCLYPCLFSCVRSDVEQKAGFDMRELQVAKVLGSNPRNKDKALFIMAATNDTMIHYSHSQKIFYSFPGKKQIQLFQGTHNSNRPESVIQKCYDFIEKQLGVERKLVHKRHNNIRLKPINKLQQKNVKSLTAVKTDGRHGDSLDVHAMETEENAISRVASDLRIVDKESLKSIKVQELRPESSPSQMELSPKKKSLETTLEVPTENISKEIVIKPEKKLEPQKQSNATTTKALLQK